MIRINPTCTWEVQLLNKNHKIISILIPLALLFFSDLDLDKGTERFLVRGCIFFNFIDLLVVVVVFVVYIRFSSFESPLASVVVVPSKNNGIDASFSIWGGRAEGCNCGSEAAVRPVTASSVVVCRLAFTKIFRRSRWGEGSSFRFGSGVSRHKRSPKYKG